MGIKKDDKGHKRVAMQIRIILLFVILILTLLGFLLKHVFIQNIIPLPKKKELSIESVSVKKVIDGIDQESGLKVGVGFNIVKQTCTGCHSSAMIVQNKATREGWLDMIRWMQKTQGLWDLGENETAILNYLETNYAPQISGRRKPLEVEVWYMIE